MRQVLLALLVGRSAVQAATWCGKAYQLGDPVIPPSAASHFTPPPLSPIPLIDFSCAQSVKPYVAGEESAGILLDLPIRFRQRAGAAWDGKASNWTVEIRLGPLLLRSSVAPGDTGVEVLFSLEALVPSSRPYILSCAASSGTRGTVLSHTTQFKFLPWNPVGSTIKMDAKRGWILVPSERGGWEPFLPTGFFAGFGGYLVQNLSVLDELKASGVNIIHPVPPFDDLDALNKVLDRMEELGLWLMYDMRWTYTDAPAVEAQVKAIKNRTNLLLWYTADEPDGFGDPLDATRKTYDQVVELDGYHPVSLVLNCEDFEWESYTTGADIVLTDPYSLYINTTFSSRYNTPCNATYGCCGCDNCLGNLTDLISRLDTFSERTEIVGRRRNLTTWTTAQAFGSSEFWWATPDAAQYAAQLIIALNHGSTGLVSWVLPTTSEILSWTSIFTSALPQITPFLFSPTATFTVPSSNDSNVDLGLWTDGTSSLLLTANLSPDGVVVTVTLPFTPAGYMNIFSDGEESQIGDHEVVLRFPGGYGVEGVRIDHATLTPTWALNVGASEGSAQVMFTGDSKVLLACDALDRPEIPP